MFSLQQKPNDSAHKSQQNDRENPQKDITKSPVFQFWLKHGHELPWEDKNNSVSETVTLQKQEAEEKEEKIQPKQLKLERPAQNHTTDITPTVVPSARQKRMAQRKEIDEDIRQNKPRGMGENTYLKISDQHESSKMVAQAKFTQYKKGQLKQLKRDKQGKIQFSSKVKNFENALIQRKVAYGSNEYSTMLGEHFPDFAEQQQASQTAVPAQKKPSLPGTSAYAPIGNGEAKAENIASGKAKGINESKIPNNLNSGLEHLTDTDVSQLHAYYHSQQPAQSASGSGIVQAQRESKPTNDTGMPDSLKSGVENLSGMSMDDIKVHRNSNKPAQMQAHAFTQGSDIHVAPGQEKHLPHEAWHVVQQKQGRVQPTTQLKGEKINDDPVLENEADVMGDKLANYSGSTAQQGIQERNGASQSPTQQHKQEFSSSIPKVTNTFQFNKTNSATVVQRSAISEELKKIWDEQGKGPFYDKLRTVSPINDSDLNAWVGTLGGDDHWLTTNIITHGKESGWPIHLKVEREMKGWSDSGGKTVVFDLLRTADGSEATNVELSSALASLFTVGSDDLWLAQNLQKYGKEKKWPVSTLIPSPTIKSVKFGGGHALTTYGGDPKVNANWTPGATDHASSFSKGSSPSLNAKFDVGKWLGLAGITGLTVRVKEGATIKGTVAASPASKELPVVGLLAAGLTGSNAVSNQNHNLVWEASVDGTNWNVIGNSGAHLVYWLHDSPKTTLYNFAAKKATDFAAGSSNVPAAIRTGLRGALNYDPSDSINPDPLTVFADGVGICTDFGNLLTQLAQTVGFNANSVMFFGGFQSLGYNIWANTAGSYINLTNVASPIAAYNPLTNPSGWAFNYHVISRIAGTLHDAALDRTGISADALHDGKIVHLVELAGTALTAGKKGTAYARSIARKDHTVAVSVRDYGPQILGSDFNTIIPLDLPSSAASPIDVSVTWSLPSGGLPAGLTLDTATGAISGTPTVDGAFTFAVRVSAGPMVYNGTASITINP